MGSMSYCRHENTASDLSEVVDNWVDDPSTLSSSERAARQDIIELARDIVEMVGED